MQRGETPFLGGRGLLTFILRDSDLSTPDNILLQVLYVKLFPLCTEYIFLYVLPFNNSLNGFDQLNIQ